MSLLRVLIFSILLLDLDSDLYGQDRSKQPKKQLQEELGRSGTDTVRIGLLLELGNRALMKPGEYKADLDSAYNYFKPALSLSEELQSPVWRIRVKQALANYYFEYGDFRTATDDYREVLSYYHTNGDKTAEAKVWATLGDRLANNSKFDHQEERLYAYDQAARLYGEIGDKVKVSYFNAMKGMVYAQQKKI